MRCLALILALLAPPAWAETLVATRTLPVRTVIGPPDVALLAESHPGYLSDPSQAIGLETTLTIFAEQPIAAMMLQAPAQIERNQVVMLVFQVGGLEILTEGRALARGSVGEVIRVMNLASRQSVFGVVQSDGTVEVR